MYDHHDNCSELQQSETFFPFGEWGRCPICGHLVELPCRACGLLSGTVEDEPDEFEPFDDIDPIDDFEPTLDLQLFGDDLIRYHEVRRMREQFAQSNA